MKVKLVSDLHLEFSDINIQNNGADVLILAGDIMVAEDLHDHPETINTAEQRAIAASTGLGRRQQAAQRYRDFLKRCSFQFPHVIYIAGNHEFYHGKFHKSIEYLRNECAKHSNIYFLENDHITIDQFIFVGGTLWTDLNRGDPITMYSIKDMMNDYKMIRNDRTGYSKITPLDTFNRHKTTLEFFKTTIDSNNDKSIVVVGHHGPSFQSVHEQYRGFYQMNGAYQSELSEFILQRPQIKLWVHGHTHHPFDYMIGGTRIVCNPRGYHNESYSEDTGWDIDKIIEL